MAPETLTPDRILEATEDVLRRYGPAKATVVDVARALGVSHGSVYRHFRTKAVLREAVTQRWLDQSQATLKAIADGSGPAPERLRAWLATLFTAKRRKAGGDPELFATYLALASESSKVVEEHVETMVGQIATIVRDGVAAGEFAPADVQTTAQAVWDASGRFHDPTYRAEWLQPGIDDAFDAVCGLILRGLSGLSGLSGAGGRRRDS
jgi:AcrR family transcriptional regulator